MAATAYPHMIFATGADVITKELLHEVLAEAYPQGTVTDAPLKSVLTLGDYAFSFWFDDEAEGLAQRYAGYLPEGARRRRLIACTTMIDFSGAPDPDQAHRADAERIVSELAELDGVWVFSEETKRFVAFDYGEPPLTDAPPPASAEPAAEPAGEPAAEPASEPADAELPTAATEPAPAPEPAPTPASSWEPRPGEPAAAASYEPPAPQPTAEPAAVPSYEPVPDRTVPLPGEASQPRPEMPRPTPPAPYGAPAWPGERTGGPQDDDDEKTGFFKRVFKRKNP